MRSNYNIISMQKRLLCIISIIAFVFLFVIGKLFWVQIIQGKTLQSRAISQWTRDLPLSGLRGSILDASGNVLASSYTSYNVYVRGSNVTDPEKVARVLADTLDVDYEKTLEKAKKKNVSESLIKQQVDAEIAQSLIKQDLNGIYISETGTRQYPYGDLLTSVLGFTTIDNVGQSGLEAYYNNFLTGTNGQTMTESTITGVEISNATTSYVPGIKGCDVTLTIDVAIQQIVENALNKAMLEHKAKGAMAIIMNPKNGEIVAMSSKPSFDLNSPPRDDVAQLMEYSKNRNIVDVYEPGSTFKIFTMSAALSSGVTNVEEKFYDPGFRIVDGQRIKCWKTKGHGSETLVEGFCNSCNSVFMDLGLRMGTDTLYSYLERFGIGSKTGVDFMGESGGIVMNKADVKNVDLARISFGQAIAVTPLQMITSVCGVLNGTLYQPRFVKSITNADGVTKQFSSVPVRKTVDESVSKEILNMMEQLVSATNGLYSFVPGYRIGGKTGTAQKYENGHVATGKYVSSFVGCYPADDPEYVMLLCVDEPGTGVYYGNLVAAPYAKLIFSQIFDYYKIAPEHLTEDLQKLQPTIEVPNLVGQSLMVAAATLKALKLEYEVTGEGERVLEQSVPAGEMLYEGAIILLKT